jgi:hypothetical protein
MAYSDWTPTAGAATASTGVMLNNRRRTFRKIVMRDGILMPSDNSAGEGTPCRVVVVDLADVGVGLRCKQPLPEGAVFWLSIPSKPDFDNSYIRIVRCRPSRGSEFEVGAQFC